MMKIIAKSLVACAILLSSTAIAMAQESSQQKMLDAVMQVYADELAKNPNDYAVLYSRANQYFLNGEYGKALDDVNAALRVTTRDDLATLVDEYMLRAKIYSVTGKPQLAITDLQEANKLDPSSEVILSMLADAYYSAADYVNARKCYQTLYRRNNVNYIAILGLARSEVKLNNIGKAEEYGDLAVDLYPAEPAVYVGRAEVLQTLGRYQEAAKDLIMALSISDGNSNALPLLMAMSDVAYGDVIAALDASIAAAPDAGMFYYIKSSVQVGHFHYADGMNTLQQIISRNLYDYHGIYYAAAEAAFNLCRYTEALNYIDTAISMNGNLTYYYVLKSQILSANNDVEGAYEAVKMASMVNASDAEVLYQKAMLDIDAGEYRMALSGLNEVLMINPSWQRARYMRAWLQKECLNDADAASTDLNELLLAGDGKELMRGFVLHQLGRDADAEKWCEEIVTKNTRAGGEACYVAAVLMSQCSKPDKAVAYLGKALDQGYGSFYNIEVNENPLQSLAMIRHLEAFKEMVSAHKK